MSITDLEFTFVETWEEAQAFIDWLTNYRGKVIAIDTETEGFDWWRMDVRLVQVGGVDHGWAFPWDRWSGLVVECLRRWPGRIAMHNFKFDCLFLRKMGVDVDLLKVDDTRTMAHLVNPARPTGLKPLGIEYFGSYAGLGQNDLKKYMKGNKWTWASVPVELMQYWAYGAMDTCLTAMLHEKLDQDLPASRRDLYDIEMAAQSVLLEMEWRGTRVDVDYCHLKQAELNQWVGQTREWAREHWGIENLTSNLQLAELLRGLGWEPEALTPTGKPKMDKEVLELLAEQYPPAKMVLDVRHAEKMANAYFGNLIGFADEDGFVHPKINPIAAITARMGVTDPALQTQPRSKLVRNAFIPRDGNKLLLVDYDQMELRLMAHFADCTKLKQLINEGVDLHTHTAAMIYGVPVEEVTKPMRTITKNAAYAKIYFSGIATFSRTAKVSPDQARQVMGAFDTVYPEIKTFMYSIADRGNDAKDPDEMIDVIAPSGRLHRAKASDSYKLVNYLIQGTGADVLKRKIVELDNAGLGEYLILPVHDEMVFDVPAEDAEDVLRTAVEIMTCNDYSVPLTVDGVAVDRWGDKYE